MMLSTNDESDFGQKIEDLASGKLDQLIIHPDDFAAFQRAYHVSPAANRIEGMAQHNGEIIYRVKQ